MKKSSIILLIFVAGCGYQPNARLEMLRNESAILKYETGHLSKELSSLQERRNTFLLSLSNDQLKCYEQCILANQQDNEAMTILKMRELRELMNDEEWTALISLIEENDQIVQKGLALVRRENQLNSQWKSAHQNSLLQYQTSQNYMMMMQNSVNQQLMLNALYGIESAIANQQ